MRTRLVMVVLLALVAACGSSGSAAVDVPDTTADGASDTAVDVPEACVEGTPCDDGDACTDGDACQADGSCVGAPRDVDDGLDCTDDACDPTTGPSHALRGGFCLIDGRCYQDGEVLLGDGCRVCKAAETFDDWSWNLGATCDDGDPCTLDDRCTDTPAGCAGAPRACDDQNPCTFDECRADVGCAHDPVNLACDDGDACTEDDRCDGGLCTPGTPVDCDDGDPCTADGCDSATGCVHGPDLAACDDDNDCTLDACTPAGCTHEAVGSGPCSDHDACTLGDTCAGDTCVPGAGAPACDDGNPCTDDSCLPAAGCVNAFNSAPCDDALACTDVDVCVYGVCVGTEVASTCPDCHYQVTGQAHKSLMIQMGSDGKPGSGLDVDGDEATCAPAGKCAAGVDNALALLSLFLNPLFSDGLASGDLAFIVEFQAPTFDGTPFTLNTFFGLPEPWFGDPDCPVTDDCTYVLPGYNFSAGCEPLVRLDDATIVDGHISAGGKDAVFPLVLPFDSGMTVQFTLLWARFEGDVAVEAETGTILTMEGLVGGAVPKAALTETILAIPDGYFTMDKQQVLNLLDTAVDQDIDLDGDGAMDALSIGFRFSTVPTTVMTY